MTLNEIESLTKKFSEAHAALEEIVADVNAEIENVKKRALPIIKRRLALTAERHAHLLAAIEGSPELFEKPRTVILHGVKIGFVKDKGGIEIDDPEKVVAQIHKQFGDAADLYLHIVEKPDKEALKKLTVAQLARLGCHLVNATDQVLIKPTNTEVDKIVNSLLKSAVEEAQAEAA